MPPPIRRSPTYRSPSALWVKVRYFTNALLSNYPGLLQILRLASAVRRLVLRESRKHLAIAIGTWRGGYRGISDVDRVCYVEPSSIVYCALREFPVPDFKGQVIDGDWDLLEKRFEDVDIYAAFREVLLEGKNWSDTVFYQRTLESLQKGSILWGCRSQEELDQRCRALQGLSQTIRTEGYKAQNQIHPTWRSKYRVWGDGEVGVSIGRHGDLLFCDGAHRLSIAKLLGIPRLSVEIVVRHAEWFRFRKHLLIYAKQHGGTVDQPLLHPDLSHLPFRGHCEALFALTKENLSVKSGRLLDLTARFGYFCHKFEDEGFECLAFEGSEEHLYFLERLRKAGNKKFRVLGNPLNQQGAITDSHYNVVLALNVSDCVREKSTRHIELLKLFTKLHTDEMLLSCPHPEQPPPDIATRDPEPPDFIRYITAHSRLKEVRRLGTLQDGSSVYKLSARQK